MAQSWPPYPQPVVPAGLARRPPHSWRQRGNLTTPQNRQPPLAPSPPSVLNCRSNKLMSFATPRQLGAVPADVKGAIVLVVDDEPAWRTILGTGLRMLGYSPLLAADT